MFWVKRNIARMLPINFFLMVSLISINGALFAQVKVTESFENAPLIETLDIISKKYSVKLAYDNAAVVGITVNMRFKKENVNEVLKKLLAGSGLEVLKINDVYVLRKQTQPLAEEVKPKKIVGIVRDKATGESLPYASVSVLGASVGTSTNADGFFSIQQGAADSINIRVSYIGFEPIEMKVAKLKYAESPVLVELDRKSIALRDVRVVKSASEIVTTGEHPGELVWNSSRVGQLPSISGIDVMAPLQMLPGVDATFESLSGLNIRHSASDKNLFIYDGFTIYHIDHFFGAFTSFNSKAIKGIRVMRGGFDARWGDRASSVVEITGKTGNENSLVVDAGGDQLSADIAMDGPIGKKMTFVLAARRSFTDYYRSNLYYNLFESARSDLNVSSKQSAFTSDNSIPKFYYYDANVKLSYKPTDKDNISLSGYRGTDDLNYTQMEGNPYTLEDSHWGNQGAGVRWSRQWSPSFYHTLTVGASEYELYYNHIDSTLKRRQNSSYRDTILRHYNIDNKLSDVTVNLQCQLRIGKINTVEGGLHTNIVDIESFESYFQASGGSIVMDTAKNNNFYSRVYTGWLQNTISVGRLKAFTLGLRATYHNLTSEYYFEPRAQVMFKLNQRLNLKLAAGFYNQYVNRIVQFGNSYRNIWVASDGDKFSVVKSKHLITGFTWNSGSGLLVDLEGYLKSTDGITVLQNVVRRTNSTQITMLTRTFLIDSRALGVDLLVKRSWANAELWAAYSLSRSFNQSESLNGGDEYYALDDHLHELKLNGIYSIGGWTFTASWIYGSAKPWDELLLTSTLQLSTEYEKNAARLSPYHRLDLGIAYTRKMLGAEVQLGLKGFNIYDRKNELSKPYSISDTPQLDYLLGNPVVVYSENYGLGFTPTFYFNVKF